MLIGILLQDIPRFKELDVYANFQPFWTVPDKGLAAAEVLLGQERAKKQYPIKAMIEAGAKVWASCLDVHLS